VGPLPRQAPIVTGKNPFGGTSAPPAAVRVEARVAGSIRIPAQRRPGTVCRPWSCLGTGSVPARLRRHLNVVHRMVTRPSRHSGMVTRRALRLHICGPGRGQSSGRRPAPRRSLSSTASEVPPVQPGRTVGDRQPIDRAGSPRTRSQAESGSSRPSPSAPGCPTIGGHRRSGTGPSAHHWPYGPSS
jgi:hypothetical protein